MTIQELGRELTNEDGSYDRSKAVGLHTQVVAAAATSAQSVIRDLHLLNRGPEAVDAGEILRALVEYAADETDQRLLAALASAADQLREVTLNLPPDQAGALREIVGQLRGARSIAQLNGMLADFESHPMPGVGDGARYARDIFAMVSRPSITPKCLQLRPLQVIQTTRLNGVRVEPC